MDTIITFIFGVITSLILVGVIYGVNVLKKLNMKIEDLEDDLEELEGAIRNIEVDMSKEIKALYDEAINQINERFKDN
jgi:prefoldin subunit 5|tara:strand:- start:504 stop:737 length:234 start_codon:yes stop_codon:yes gene_type:complete